MRSRCEYRRGGSKPSRDNVGTTRAGQGAVGAGPVDTVQTTAEVVCRRGSAATGRGMTPRCAHKLPRKASISLLKLTRGSFSLLKLPRKPGSAQLEGLLSVSMSEPPGVSTPPGPTENNSVSGQMRANRASSFLHFAHIGLPLV
eukprot:4381310-Prymnesium_polylepis.1